MIKLTAAFVEKRKKIIAQCSVEEFPILADKLSPIRLSFLEKGLDGEQMVILTAKVVGLADGGRKSGYIYRHHDVCNLDEYGEWTRFADEEPAETISVTM